MRRGDAAFDVTGGLFSHRIGKGARGDLDGMTRQQGDAVETLLTDDLGLVARRLDLEARKLRLLRLDLLQDDDVRLGVLQPRHQISGPLADRVDVPGRDFHEGDLTMVCR